MTRKELLELIINRTYYCELCADLKKDVIRNGLQAITDYQGFICPSIQDMKIRLSKVKD
jgi:hypothetical protein